MSSKILLFKLAYPILGLPETKTLSSFAVDKTGTLKQTQKYVDKTSTIVDNLASIKGFCKEGKY